MYVCMYVRMNIKCGSMSPFLNLVHRFKLYKRKLTVKSVCNGWPPWPRSSPFAPSVQVRWCLLVLLISFCFLFFFNLVLPFFFFYNEDRRVRGSALWNVHVLWSWFPPPVVPPPSSPATTQPLLDSPPQELVSLSHRARRRHHTATFQE